MRKRGLWVALLVMIGAAQADEVIYRSEGAGGQPSFSDRPAAGAEPVELPPVNTVPPPDPASGPAAAPQEAFSGYRVTLTAPQTVANGLVPTPVGIEVQPELRPGHHWQLVLDGEVVAEGDGTGGHSLGALSRGPHHLLLQVVDGGGEVLASDGPARLFVLRPGQN